MATRFEYYDVPSTSPGVVVAAATWAAQTFTPLESHTITSVKIIVRRGGASHLPGIAFVSIRAVASELPTGNDLVTPGFFDADELPSAVAGELKEIALGSSLSLDAGIMYAIVVRAPNGNTSSHRLIWGVDTTGSYSRGSWATSSDSGSTWTRQNYPAWVYDFGFEEWGNPEEIAGPPEPEGGSLSIVGGEESEQGSVGEGADGRPLEPEGGSGVSDSDADYAGDGTYGRMSTARNIPLRPLAPGDKPAPARTLDAART